MNESVQILYASASGSTRAVAEYISTQLDDASIDSQLTRVEKYTQEEFINSKYQIFALSTWTRGSMNPYFNDFYKSLSKQDLSGKCAGFVGTGDLRYEPILFCTGMTTLKDKYLDLGGKEITSSLKINGNPYPQLETLVKRWSDKFIADFNKL